ncbi:MAG: hypothetical protein V3T17_15160 [Pseudomonadales bacterium]
MQPTNDVVQLNRFKRESEQEIIEDISARTFLFLRNEAEEMDVPIKDVIVEHMIGLALVMCHVEGEDEAQNVLKNISEQLNIG